MYIQIDFKKTFSALLILSEAMHRLFVHLRRQLVLSRLLVIIVCITCITKAFAKEELGEPHVERLSQELVNEELKVP